MEPDDYSKEELYNQIQELRQGLNEIKEQRNDSEGHNEQNNSDNTTLSRRSFLKKAGLGAMGIGAASIIPNASALNIDSDKPLDYNESFSVDTEGNLDLSGSNVENAGSVSASTVDAQSLSDSWLIPENDTIQAIQNIIDNNRNPSIRLKPGVVYSGDTQIVIDSSPDSGPYAGQDRQIEIYAHGAGVNYTGSGDTAVQLKEGDIYDTGTGDATAFGGNVKILYGTWSGPGEDVNHSAAIRGDDCFGATVMPSRVGDAENGVIFVNNGAWNEGHFVKIPRFGRCEQLSVAKPKYLVRFAGGNSYFPDAGANDASASFRDSEVRIEFDKAANGKGGATFYQDHASTHGAKHVIRGFLPRGGTGYLLESEAAINRLCRVHFECEGGDSESTAIDVSDAQGVPFFLGARIQSDGTEVKGDIVRLDGAGWQSNTPLKIMRNNDGGFKNTWLEMNDPSNYSQTLYEITNRQNSFALKHHNDSFVGSFNSSNDYAPFRGSEFQARGAVSGNRAFKGKFDEHPSNLDNGDVWYITGNGNSEEGFYGKGSKGKVKLS